MQSLEKRLGFFSALMLVMGSIIGSGIFKKMAPMWRELHSGGWVLLAWIVAGLVTLGAAFIFAELAERMAATGGLYAYLKKSFGPGLAFFYGFSCFIVIQTASFVSIGYVFSESIGGLFQASAMEVRGICVATIWFLTLANICGVIWGARITNVFTLFKVVGIFAVIGIGFFAGAGSVESFSFASQSEASVDSLSWNTWIGVFFTAMLACFWAYDGWNNIAYIGGEVKDARKNIKWAIIWGVFAVMGVYLLFNAAALYALTPVQLEELTQKRDSIFAIEMIRVLMGSYWGYLMTFLIAVSTFATTNASLLSSSRIYYAMAEDRNFFPTFGKLHPRFHTPYVSLIFQALWGTALVFIGTFDELTDMLIFAGFIFNGLGSWALLKARKNQVGQSNLNTPLFVIFGYFVFSVAMVGVQIFQNPEQTFKGLLLLGLGVPLFGYFRFLSKSSQVSSS